MTEKKSPVISFKDFSFQYRAQKKPTLTGINLDIYPGEKVLIAGPSGSGKSTLAGCINGLNPFSNPGECKTVPTWADSSKILLCGASTPSTVSVPLHSPGLEKGFRPLMHPASVLLPLPDGPAISTFSPG